MARRAGNEDLPPPLFTGILALKPAGYQHSIASWRWDPEICEWIGTCRVCKNRFRADLRTARRLERELEEWCGANVAASPA